jgi:hypothetical protein
MAKSRRQYSRAPRVDDTLVLRRFTAIVDVMAGRISVTEGAERLGLSRLRFQSMSNRALEAMLTELAPKPPGRPKRSDKERQLEYENKKLKERLDRALQEQYQNGRMLEALAKALRPKKRAAPGSTQRRAGRPKEPTSTSPAPTAASSSDSDDDGPAARLRSAEALVDVKVPVSVVAPVVGVSTATLRRWRARRRAGLPLRTRAARRRTDPPPELVQELEAAVRSTEGLVGAAGLCRLVPGASRRQAASVKDRVVCEVERERKADCTRVVVAQPGVVRGFDQLWALSTDGLLPALVTADAAVPFRTSITLAKVYDARSVARALDRDFSLHGAPLVLRLDQAKCHDAEPVPDVLAEHRVLALHGPPRYPQYYGQLERQNREHRAWLDRVGPLSAARLADELDRMRVALNASWPRRTLGWQTAEERWNQRPLLSIDRDALCDEVTELAHSLRPPASTHLNSRCPAWRRAIELTLTRHGLLTKFSRGDCYDIPSV